MSKPRLGAYSKLDPRWDGPFVIIDIPNPGHTLKILKRGSESIVAQDRCKAFIQRDGKFLLCDYPPPDHVPVASNTAPHTSRGPNITDMTRSNTNTQQHRFNLRSSNTPSKYYIDRRTHQRKAK